MTIQCQRGETVCNLDKLTGGRKARVQPMIPPIRRGGKPLGIADGG
jgi:hypothetical protein